MKTLLFAIVALVLTLTCVFQDPQVPLTNDDVARMFGAGLTETTIVQVIQKGPSNFDITPDALIKLKQQGVTAKIIEAMVATKTTPNSSTPTETVINSRGVFAQNGAGWKRIEEISSIEVRNVGNISSAVTMGIKEARVICVFRGEKAELQLDNPRPVFRIAGMGASARDVYIVAMRLNPDRRDLEMGRYGLIKKLSYGFRKRDVRDVMVTRLGDDLLEVMPKENLEPGEYIMILGGVAVPLTAPVQRSGSRTVGVPVGTTTGMPTATQGATGYDFGIIVPAKVASNH